MRYLPSLFLGTVLCVGQSININAGGPAIGSFVADQGFSGGLPYGPSQQSDLSTQMGVYQTLRYGTSFSYDIPESNGTCTLKLDLLENRPAGPNPATQSAVGTRLFSVTANGVSTGTIDIFSAIGAQKPYNPPLLTVPVNDGHLRLSFLSTQGNAVVSGIEVTCTPTPPQPALTIVCTLPVVCTYNPATNQYTIQLNQPIAKADVLGGTVLSVSNFNSLSPTDSVLVSFTGSGSVRIWRLNANTPVILETAGDQPRPTLQRAFELSPTIFTSTKEYAWVWGNSCGQGTTAEISVTDGLLTLVSATPVSQCAL